MQNVIGRCDYNPEGHLVTNNWMNTYVFHNDVKCNRFENIEYSFANNLKHTRKSVVLGGAQAHNSCCPGKHPNNLDHQHHLLLPMFSSSLRAYSSDSRDLDLELHCHLQWLII